MSQQTGDLISRQAVFDILEKEGHKWGNDYRDWVDAIEEIKKLPSVNLQKTQMIDKSNFDQEQYKADLQCAYDCGKASVNPQEPETGHWIETDSDDAYWYMCSECHRRTDEKSDYCPNCGSRMVESQESEDEE